MDHTHAPFMQRLADAVQATGVTDAQLDLLASSETLMTDWVSLLVTLTEYDAAPIAILALDPHTTNIFKWAGIHTIWQLRQRRAAELLSIPGIGPRVLVSVIAKLSELGLSLRPDPEDEPPSKTQLLMDMPDRPDRRGMRALLERVFREEPSRVEYYAANLAGFQRLVSWLKPRTRTIIIVSFGLHDGVIRTHTETATVLDISTGHVGTIVGEAASSMFNRDQGQRLRAEHSEPTGETSIDTLDLSERPDECLRRAGILTVEELCERTEDDLLAITNFGQKSLDEVIAKLDTRGLSLRQE